MALSDRQKSILGHMLLLIAIIAAPFHIYLIFLALSTCNWYLILYVSFIQLCGTFSKKNSYFIKFGLWFKITYLFDHTDIIEEEKVPDSNCLIGFHPHGIYTYGLVMNANTPGTFFANMVGLGSRVALNIPIAAILLKSWGIQSVDANNFRRLLKKGTNCGLYPGGFEEATLTTKTENRVFIKNRKGFVKYALQYGTTLFPAFTFGENQMFNTFDRLTDFRLVMNKYKIVTTFFWSRLGACPEPHMSLVTVVGKGIKCPQIDNPSNQQVDLYHAMYVNGLIEIYDKYQPQYAPNIKLKIY